MFKFKHRTEATPAPAAASRPARQRPPIVTEVTPAGIFYEAEDYHQQYLEKQGRAACAVTLR